MAGERVLPIEVFTSTHRVVGEVSVPHAGLFGLMNNPTFSVLTLRKVRMARLSAPTRVVAAYSQLALTKRGIHVVLVSDPEMLGSRAFGGYSITRTYRVWATSQNFEYRGELSWSGRFDAALILTAQEGRDFLPFLDVEIRDVMLPTLHLKVPAALVNRRKLDLFAREDLRQSQPAQGAGAPPPLQEEA